MIIGHALLKTAQDLFVNICENERITSVTSEGLVRRFLGLFLEELHGVARDPIVVGFKSVVCYRAGLAVTPLPRTHIEAISSGRTSALIKAVCTDDDIFMDAMFRNDLVRLANDYVQSKKTGKPAVRIAYQSVNDFVVGVTMVIAGMYGKPGVYVKSGVQDILSRDCIFSPIPHWPRRLRHHPGTVVARPSPAAYCCTSRHPSCSIAYIVSLYS